MPAISVIQAFQPNSSKYTPDNLTTDHIAVFIWQHLLSSEELESMQADGSSELSADKLQGKRRCERLSLILMARQLLGPQTTIGHTPQGKPFLVNSGLHISISHTEGAYALSIGTLPHGIDIERPSIRALYVRSRFLSEREQQFRLTEKATPAEEATALWCAKEAAFKLFSDEATTHLGHICLKQPCPFLPLKAISTASHTDTEAEVSISSHNGLILAICHP